MPRPADPAPPARRQSVARYSIKCAGGVRSRSSECADWRCRPSPTPNRGADARQRRAARGWSRRCGTCKARPPDCPAPSSSAAGSAAESANTRTSAGFPMERSGLLGVPGQLLRRLSRQVLEQLDCPWDAIAHETCPSNTTAAQCYTDGRGELRLLTLRLLATDRIGSLQHGTMSFAREAHFDSRGTRHSMLAPSGSTDPYHAMTRFVI